MDFVFSRTHTTDITHTRTTPQHSTQTQESINLDSKLMSTHVNRLESFTNFNVLLLFKQTMIDKSACHVTTTASDSPRRQRTDGAASPGRKDHWSAAENPENYMDYQGKQPTSPFSKPISMPHEIMARVKQRHHSWSAEKRSLEANAGGASASASSASPHSSSSRKASESSGEGKLFKLSEKRSWFDTKRSQALEKNNFKN